MWENFCIFAKITCLRQFKMGNNNKTFTKARASKNDEFYTQLCDIEKELPYYKDFLVGKIVYCNCDNPSKSKFTEYFLINFHELGLKKLISTGYNMDGGRGFSLSFDGVEKKEDFLEGNGDFRNDECIEFLKECDVVITNPPFSHFREFFTTLMKYNKKFLVIGNTNASCYKEVFPYVLKNEFWAGLTNYNVGMHFVIPDSYEQYKYIDEDGNKIGRVSTSCWWTNIQDLRANMPITLTKTYNPTDYPKYDNCDAIEVNNYKNIPLDYDGVIGVPITFLGHYCSKQFEVLGKISPVLNGKELYSRLLIKKK